MQASRAFCAAASVALLLAITSCTSVSEPDPGDGNNPPPPLANAKWSDPSTWGGAVPVEGAEVVIPAGKDVLLDVTPPALGSLTINGSLTFSPNADLALTSRWIMVAGTLQIGTESQRRTKKATITLTGAGDGDFQGMGDKVLGVMAGDGSRSTARPGSRGRGSTPPRRPGPRRSSWPRAPTGGSVTGSSSPPPTSIPSRRKKPRSRR